MEILKLVSVGIIATLHISVVSLNGGHSKTFGDIIRIVVVTLFMIFIATQLSNVFAIIRNLANKLSMEDTYLKIVLQVIGIAYIAEFGVQLCEDAGEKAIGGKIQLAGKVMIFMVASPVILALIDMIAGLI